MERLLWEFLISFLKVVGDYLALIRIGYLRKVKFFVILCCEEYLVLTMQNASFCYVIVENRATLFRLNVLWMV